MNRADLNIILNNYPRKSVFLGSALVVLLFFPSLRLQAQVISNNGAAISITAGTVVVSQDLINTSGVNQAKLKNFGTLNLSRDFKNRALSITSGNGIFRIGRNWSNSGIFSHDLSTVIFNGLGEQKILNPLSETFFKLSLENTGASSGFYIRLGTTVKIMETLTMHSGNVITFNHILQLENTTSASLNYTSVTESRIFGLFERGIGETGRFLFPLGDSLRPSYYNPATLVIKSPFVTGSVLSEFIASSPGNAGLPLADISVSPEVEISNAFTTGYWNMTAKKGLSVSNYDIELDASGFENATDTVKENTRVIKRIAGSNWTFDGVHVDASGNLVKRNNLTGDVSASTTQLALGQANPLITGHPDSLIVCENSTVSFSVTASGAEPLTYLWYKDGTAISGGDPRFTGYRSATLTIADVILADAGTYYCVVRDRFFNTTTSKIALLTVMKIPAATASYYAQEHECSEIPFKDIVLSLSHYDSGTRFVWSRTTPGGIVTTIPASGTEYNIGDVLSGAFENTINEPVTITFTIIPIGPAPTECTGQPITSSVTVNPKPRIISAVTSEICYGDKVEIKLISDTELTMPKEDVLTFGYKTYRTDASVTGFMGVQSNIVYGTAISNSYQNTSDTSKSIFYRIVPTFTSALGCYPGDTIEFETKIHAKPLQKVDEIKSLTCDGGGDAEIEAITSRGAGGYLFEWKRGENRIEHVPDTLKNADEGVWYVTVTDGFGCENTENISIAAGYKLRTFMAVWSFNGSSPYSTSCPGAADGRIGIMEESTSAGIAPFKYQIFREGETTPVDTGIMDKNVYTDLYGFSKGKYTMHIEDDNGCYNNANVLEAEITEPPKIEVTFESFGASCHGYGDGNVKVSTISGGNGGYRYKWTAESGVISGNDTLDRLENIYAGKYYLLITDAMGCTKIDSVIITEPAGMVLVSSEVHNVSCNGGQDGKINLTISGGSGNYTFQWTAPNTMPNQRNISELPAGIYKCVVSDLNGCTLQTPSFTLTEPPAINIAAALSVSKDGAYNIDCYGGTGTVQVTVTGGAGGYQYLWNTTNGSGIVAGQKDQAALKAGNYVLTVKDINGCEKAFPITLTQPNALNLTMTVIKHITCGTTLTDGEMTVDVLGGIAPYSYLWSTGATTNHVVNLSADIHFVAVTDKNDCTVKDSAEIIKPPLLTHTSQTSDYNGFNVSCFDMSNGYIDINITGGTAPFKFIWTGPDGFTAATQNISGLKAGTYTVNISDNFGCTASQTFHLTQPNKLGMNITVFENLNGYNVKCAGDMTGYIDINPFNNVGKVEYLWSDGLFGKSRNNLPAGSYNVIITDSNGCYSDSSVTLIEPVPLKIRFLVEQPFCTDMADGVIWAEASGGIVGNYSYLWEDNSTGRSLKNIKAGVYELTVEDRSGCVVRDSVKVEPQNKSCLIIPNAISPNYDLINDVWNIGNIELYPNAEVKIFNRWGNNVWSSEKGYPRPWDGTRNGRELPIDSYHYIINLNNGEKPIIGTITIVK